MDTALMVNSTFGRAVMELGSKRRIADKIQTGLGEPGILRGQ
jgi:hypothetical protein